jgi:hypothetical protein
VHAVRVLFFLEIDMTQDKCQGCAVQQGYVPVGAVAQIQDASRLPEIKDMLNSPQTLNNNDRAFWVLGWNECRDAAKSLIAHIAELEAQLAAVQQRKHEPPRPSTPRQARPTP